MKYQELWQNGCEKQPDRTLLEPPLTAMSSSPISSMSCARN
jgi:hypothetical protein